MIVTGSKIANNLKNEFNIESIPSDMMRFSNAIADDILGSFSPIPLPPIVVPSTFLAAAFSTPPPPPPFLFGALNDMSNAITAPIILADSLFQPPTSPITTPKDVVIQDIVNGLKSAFGEGQINEMRKIAKAVVEAVTSGGII